MSVSISFSSTISPICACETSTSSRDRAGFAPCFDCACWRGRVLVLSQLRMEFFELPHLSSAPHLA